MKHFAVLFCVVLGFQVSAQEIALALPRAHGEFVMTTDYSPDGKLIASGAYDETVMMFDAETGVLLYQLEDLSEKAMHVEFSPSGEFLVTAFDYGSTILYDVNSGQKILHYADHQHAVNQARFSHDSKLMATASFDKSVNISDVETGELLHSILAHSGSVKTVEFSADDKLLVTTSLDNSVAIIEVETGAILYSFKDHNKGVNSAHFSPNGLEIVTSSDDGTAFVYDMNAGIILHTFTNAQGGYNDAHYSPNGRLIVTSAEGGLVNVYNARSRELERSLSTESSAAKRITISGNSQLTAVVSMGNTLQLFNIVTGEFLRAWVNYSQRTALKFSANNQYVMSTSFGRGITVYDVDLEEPKTEILTQMYDSHSVCMNPKGNDIAVSMYGGTRIVDFKTGKTTKILGYETGWRSEAHYDGSGKYLIACSAKKDVHFFNAKSGKKIRSIPGHLDVRTAELSIGENYLITAGDTAVRVFDFETGELLQVLGGYPKGVTSASISPDGRHVLTTSTQSVKVYNLESGEVVQDLSGITSWVNAAKFSPDGSYIVAGVQNGKVMLFDWENDKLIYELDEFSKQLYCSIEFSSSGNKIAITSNDHKVRVIETETGKVLNVFSGHYGHVYSAAFSTDGKFLTSSSKDGGIIVYDLETGKELIRQYYLGSNDPSMWVQITPSGHMECAPEAEDFLAWTSGLAVSSFDKYKNDFFVKGLWKKVMKGSDLPLIHANDSIGNIPLR